MPNLPFSQLLQECLNYPRFSTVTVGLIGENRIKLYTDIYMSLGRLTLNMFIKGVWRQY